jgi:peptidoglycan lytic transglycosylase
MLVACAASVFLSEPTNAESGIASVYSNKGGHTASGESAHSSAFTGAHRTLAFGTWVKVTNKRNGKTVLVRINDRGPFQQGRVIDLSPAAAQILDFSGLTPVSITVLE